jgi:hypothetical protein
MQDPGPRRRNPRPGRRLLGLTLVAAVALTQAGCLLVAAGVAGGAAATGYVYYKGRLYRDYPAGLGDSLAAVRTALVELQFPITGEEVKNGSGYLTSKTADGSTVRIYLEPVASRVPAEGTLTRVSIRVGAFGDEAVSTRLLDQVSLHLVPAPPARTPVGPQTFIQPTTSLQPGETNPPPLAAPLPQPAKTK